MRDEPEELEFGNFKILRRENGDLWELGRGGFGTTYKAEHKHLMRACALKVINDNRVASEDARRRFLQEARAAASLLHPHIAAVYDFGESNGTFYYAMEYCAGGDLEHYVTNKGALSWAELEPLTVQMASALSRAHQSGLLHRDLKPSNVMLSSEGQAEPQLKLIDFGLVKVLDHIKTSSTQVMMTQEGAAGFNPLTASPEQLRDEDLDERSDLFSFGITLLYLLCGGVPFGSVSAPLMMAQRLDDESYDKLLPDELTGIGREVVSRLIQKDRDQRYRSADDVLNAIQSASQSSVILPPTEPPSDTPSEEVDPSPVETIQEVDWTSAWEVKQIQQKSHSGAYYRCVGRQQGIPDVVMFMPSSDSSQAETILSYADRLVEADTHMLLSFVDAGYMDGERAYLCDPFMGKGGKLLQLLQAQGSFTLQTHLPLFLQLSKAIDEASDEDLPGIELNATMILVDEGEMAKDSIPSSADDWLDYYKERVASDPSFAKGVRLTVLPKLEEPSDDEDIQATVTLEDLATDPMTKFGSLIYRSISGMSVRPAAYLRESGYVSTSNLGEESNRFLSEIIANRSDVVSATEIIEKLCDFEGVTLDIETLDSLQATRRYESAQFAEKVTDVERLLSDALELEQKKALEREERELQAAKEREAKKLAKEQARAAAAAEELKRKEEQARKEEERKKLAAEEKQRKEEEAELKRQKKAEADRKKREEKEALAAAKAEEKRQEKAEKLKKEKETAATKKSAKKKSAAKEAPVAATAAAQKAEDKKRKQEDEKKRKAEQEKELKAKEAAKKKQLEEEAHRTETRAKAEEEKRRLAEEKKESDRLRKEALAEQKRAEQEKKKIEQERKKLAKLQGDEPTASKKKPIIIGVAALLIALLAFAGIKAFTGDDDDKKRRSRPVITDGGDTDQPDVINPGDVDTPVKPPVKPPVVTQTSCTLQIPLSDGGEGIPDDAEIELFSAGDNSVYGDLKKANGALTITLKKLPSDEKLGIRIKQKFYKVQSEVVLSKSKFDEEYVYGSKIKLDVHAELVCMPILKHGNADLTQFKQTLFELLNRSDCYSITDSNAQKIEGSTLTSNPESGVVTINMPSGWAISSQTAQLKIIWPSISPINISIDDKWKSEPLWNLSQDTKPLDLSTLKDLLPRFGKVEFIPKFDDVNGLASLYYFLRSKSDKKYSLSYEQILKGENLSISEQSGDLTFSGGVIHEDNMEISGAVRGGQLSKSFPSFPFGYYTGFFNLPVYNTDPSSPSSKTWLTVPAYASLNFDSSNANETEDTNSKEGLLLRYMFSPDAKKWGHYASLLKVIRWNEDAGWLLGNSEYLIEVNERKLTNNSIKFDYTELFDKNWESKVGPEAAKRGLTALKNPAEKKGRAKIKMELTRDGSRADFLSQIETRYAEMEKDIEWRKTPQGLQTLRHGYLFGQGHPKLTLEAVKTLTNMGK